MTDPFGPGERRRYLPHMIPTPTEILERIKDGTLLPPAVIGALDHDSILDERDGDADFEAHWKRCYDEIEAKWATAEVDKDAIALKDDRSTRNVFVGQPRT